MPRLSIRMFSRFCLLLLLLLLFRMQDITLNFEIISSLLYGVSINYLHIHYPVCVRIICALLIVLNVSMFCCFCNWLLTRHINKQGQN